MGSLLCTRLATVVDQVIAVDLQNATPFEAENVVSIQSDVCGLSSAAKVALAQADLVILALPEHVALAALPDIAMTMRENALLVDTLSVKTPFVKAIRDSRHPKEVISINPMFAPSLGFHGQSTAVITIEGGPLAERFLEFIEAWGCRLAFLTAEEHDKLAAMLQTVTHAAILAFGMSLHKLGYDLAAAEPLAPPPHRAMLALVARILGADPEVYWDIQSSNPFAAEARQALEDSVKQLSAVVDSKNQSEFLAIIDDLHKLIGKNHLPQLQQYCARLFNMRDEPR